MKDTFEVSNLYKKNIFKIIIVITIFSVIIFSALIFMIVFNSNTKYNKISIVEGTVINIEKEEFKDNVFYILLDNSNVYKITSLIGEKIPFTSLQEINNKNVKLHIYPFVAKSGVIGIECSSFNFDPQEGFRLIKSNNNTSVIVIGILFAFFVGLNILLLGLYLKQKKMVVKSVWDYYTFAGRRTPLRKKYVKYTLISIGIIFLIGIPSTIHLGNQNDTSVAFYTTIGSFIGLFIIWSCVALGLLPTIRKRDIEFYDGLYNLKISNIDESVIETKFYDNVQNYIFKFTEKGLNCDVDEMVASERMWMKQVAFIEKQKNPAVNELELVCGMENLFLENAFGKDCNFLNFTYEDLKFYTKVIFSPTGAISVFIVSNLTDKTKKVLENNIILELNESSYYWIKKYNITVLGLDEFLKNRMQHMLKNCKGKQTAISYNN